MPLLLSKKISPTSAYAIWKISETKWVLNEHIDAQPPKEILNQNKRSEWIVTRILIKYLCNGFGMEYKGMDNHPTGKPYLIGHDAEISLSHSFPMAAAMINLDKPCGIDLEWPREKLSVIQDKFLNKSEMGYKDDLESLCRVWLAKEVLFKIHGKKELSFKDEMRVKLLNAWELKGAITKNGHEEDHQIHVESVFNYLLAYNV